MTVRSKSIESAQDVYRAGGELYHLQRARREYGDDQVVIKLANGFRDREGLNTSDAYIRAGQYLNDIDRMINREFGFKEMCASLEDERSSFQSTAALFA